MTAHIHAENMRLYAEDAAKTEEPWKLWELRKYAAPDSWMTLQQSPCWAPTVVYRRKQLTVNYHGVMIQPPRTTPPADGTRVWSALSPLSSRYWHSGCIAEEAEMQRDLAQGFLHSNFEAAQLHNQAIRQHNMLLLEI